MTKTLLLVFALMFSTVWMQAQDQTTPQDQQPQAQTPQDQYPQGQQPTQAPQATPQDQTAPTDSGQMGQSASQTSVEGCLDNSNGNYMLTTASGASYQLEGDTAKLSNHVGHEVRVTGTASASSNNETTGSSNSATTGSSGSQTSSAPTLNVQSIMHLSKTCKNTGMTK